MAVRQGRPSRCVTERRPHDMRTMQPDLESAQRIMSWARDTQPIRGVRSSLTIRLARGCKCWHLLAPGRRYGARRSPLSEYMSLHLSLKLTTKWVPLSRIKWERHIFIKKCCFVRSLKFVHYFWLCSWLGKMRLYTIMIFGAVTRIWNQSMGLLWFWDSSRNCRGPYYIYGKWEMHLWHT